MAKGKIKFKYQHNPHYTNQKYMLTEAENVLLPFTEENVIAFCKTPRQKCDISEHFKIGSQLCRNFVEYLVEEGKLKYTKSIKIDSKIMQRMLKSNG